MMSPFEREVLQTFDGAPVDVLVLGLLQRRILVEQVGHIGQVQLGVAADDVGRRDELAAAQPIGLLQHALRPLQVLLLLRGLEVNARGSGSAGDYKQDTTTTTAAAVLNYVTHPWRTANCIGGHLMF